VDPADPQVRRQLHELFQISAAASRDMLEAEKKLAATAADAARAQRELASFIEEHPELPSNVQAWIPMLREIADGTEAATQTQRDRLLANRAEFDALAPLDPRANE
jgi:hypothetical protein